MAKNIKRMTNLKTELEKVLSRYHQNSLDSIAAIKHLLAIATEFKNDDKQVFVEIKGNHNTSAYTPDFAEKILIFLKQ